MPGTNVQTLNYSFVGYFEWGCPGPGTHANPLNLCTMHQPGGTVHFQDGLLCKCVLLTLPSHAARWGAKGREGWGGGGGGDPQGHQQHQRSTRHKVLVHGRPQHCRHPWVMGYAAADEWTG